jgi:PAS domain S-box-containing protein
MENTFGKNIIPDNDPERLNALKRYQILDSPPEPAFDRIAQLATKIFQTPVSLISMVDTERVFFKANIGGGDEQETPRGLSLCSLAVLSPEVLVFENAPEDPCLLTNPHVAAEHGVKFYAGAPLITPDNFQIGTICVVDFAPREFSEQDKAIMEDLAAMVMREIELRLAANTQTGAYQSSLQEMSATNDELEKKVAERTQKAINSEVRFRSIFEKAPLAFCILTGPSLIIEYANELMLRLWNKTAAVIGQPHHQVRSAPEVAGFLKVMDEVYATGVPFTATELKAYTDKGNKYEWGYFNFTYQAIRDDDALITGLLAIVEDVTETVLTREGSVMVNDQLGLAADAANLGIWQIHPETKALLYSPKLAEIFGYEGKKPMTYEQAIGQVTDEYRPQILEQIEQAIANGGSYDFIYQQRRFNDDALIWLRSSGKVTRDNDGDHTLFSGVVMDMSERKTQEMLLETLNAELLSANEKYKQTEDELQLAINAASLATFDLNPVTGRFAGNDLLRSWFGLQPEEEIALNKATDVIAEADRGRVLAAIQQALTYASGGDYDVRYTIINPLNPVPRIVRAKGKALFNEQQHPMRLSGVLQDVTEQTHDEQRKSDFIGMVSHELKTPLTSLTAIVQVANGKLKSSEDQFLVSAMAKAGQQVQRMSKMINGFLDISRLESSKIMIDKQTFEINELFREMIAETQLTVTSHRIAYSGCDGVKLNADRDKIGSVITNLVGNAVKYSPKGKQISVSCQANEQALTVAVKDEGMGIKPEYIGKVFDRYFRVETSHTRHISGFGIGLYLSAEIIHRHDGQIWVESESGSGSTFYFSLPLKPAKS